MAIDAESFWSHVDNSAGADSCWPWKGTVSGKGYGYFGHRRAHRVAFELAVGPIQDGMVIDHVRARGCTSRLCCNPAHLQQVTNRQNVLRGDHPNAVTYRTNRCRRGHSMRGAKVTKKGRECRQCIRDREAARRQAVTP